MYFKKGDHVILADNEETRTDHLEKPEWYPAPGTRGIVTEDSDAPYVQWEDGSTSEDDVWANTGENLILESEAE